MTTWTQFCQFLTTYSPPYGKCNLSMEKKLHCWPPTHLLILTQSLNDPITEKRCKMLNRCFFYSRYQIFEFQVHLNLNNTERLELLKNLMIPHESKLVWIISRSIFIINVHLTCVKKIGSVQIMCWIFWTFCFDQRKIGEGPKKWKWGTWQKGSLFP